MALDVTPGLDAIEAETTALLAGQHGDLNEQQQEDVGCIQTSAAELRQKIQPLHKDQFDSSHLAVMSRRLRTSGNVIVGFSRALQKGISGAVSTAQMDALQIIYEQGRNLITLANDSIDYAHLQNKSLGLKPETLNLTDMIERAVQAYDTGQPLFSIKQRGADNLQVDCDLYRTWQILHNMLRMVVQANTTREITLTIDSAETHATIDIETQIPHAEAVALLEPDDKLTLPVVAGLAAAQGGALRIDSGEAGAVFHVSFPITP
jgi:signal transduction histidine kinase